MHIHMTLILLTTRVINQDDHVWSSHTSTTGMFSCPYITEQDQNQAVDHRLICCIVTVVVVSKHSRIWSFSCPTLPLWIYTLLLNSE